jgi:hypothetical protein
MVIENYILNYFDLSNYSDILDLFVYDLFIYDLFRFENYIAGQ